MNKYFRKFLINNHIKATSENTNKAFLCVDRGRLDTALLCSFFSILINYKFKYKPIILSDLKKKEVYELYKSFGFNKFLIGFRYFLFFVKPIIFIKSLFLTTKLIFTIKKKGLYWFVNNFKLLNIRIGDLVHDQYIRNEKSYLRTKVDIKYINIIFKAIFRTLNISKIIKLNDIKYIIVGTETYAHNDAITLRLGLESNIPVIEPQLANLGFFRYQKYHIVHGRENIFYNKRVKIVKNYEKNIDKINSYLKKRLEGKGKDKYTLNHLLIKTNSKKSEYIKRDEFIQKYGHEVSKIKKIVLFSCHAFSDANHVLGNNFLFTDYYDHLKKTLEFINKENNQNILWAVRPNPTSLNDDEYADIYSLIKTFNNKKIIVTPKKITSVNLSEICDNVITGRGTVALEFACKGKYGIIAGSGNYSNLGFTYEFKNRDKYFQCLKNIVKIHKLTKEKIILAKKTLYYLENNVDSFFLEYFNKKERNKFLKNSKFLIDESLLSNVQHDSKKSVFCKKLLDNLKNFSLNNNDYVKYFLKKI
tara:strand:+ start:5473 stop:7065 length:1593 start_codon:yes stop_codon:yes gene_type:complete